MEVKYIPADWKQMKSSIGELIGKGVYGKGMIDDLKDVTRNLEGAESDIARYDSDGVVRFSHIDRESTYQEIFEDFEVMRDFTGKVGDIVNRTIDQPFYEDIDAFVSAMQQATISKYTTKNRIGLTDEVTYYAQGMNYTTREPKSEVSLDDLLSGDNFYATQMNIEYDMWKAENPDQDFSQEEYRMAAVNMNAFEYNSIEDQQLNKEFWVNIGALVMMVGATVVAVVVPPVGVPLALTIGTTYGALELGTAVTGKDWISGRELGTGERWMRGLLSPLDIVPGVAGMKKFATGTRLGNQVVNLGEMAVKPGLKSTIKREIIHVGDMMNTAGKMTVQRVKSAGAAIKDAAHVAKNKLAKDIQDIGRVADSAITSTKNITSTRKVVEAGDIGKLHIPAENTHFFENKAKQMFSKAEDVHVVGGTKSTGKGGKTNIYSVEDFLNEMNSLPHVKLSKEVTDGLISTPKGKRPLPEVYMTKEEISSHLALFDEGAVKIQSRESYEQVTKLYGSDIGDPKTGTYVLPKNVVDKAVESSNGNPRVLEELLGLEKGYLGEKPIMLKISEFENIKIPSGNEAGAWQGFWEPGGYTQGGVPEAVIDQIKSKNYTVSDIY